MNREIRIPVNAKSAQIKPKLRVFKSFNLKVGSGIDPHRPIVLVQALFN